jgi:hypothetical protein
MKICAALPQRARNIKADHEESSFLAFSDNANGSEDVLAGKEILDLVEAGRIPAMDRDAVVPEPAVALESGGRVMRHGRH